MNIGAFLKTTKGKVISIGGGSAVAVGIGLAILLQGGGYRTISVEQVAGIVNIIGEKNNGQAYQGQRLYSGDDVTVMEASELTMCMDGDKYVYADANTHFQLEASDKSDDSKIKITMDAGSELNVLESSLGPNDTYEVDTPNSTMSVRGTTFRVTVYKGPDGLIYTLVEVEEGQVLVRLKTTDGSYNGVEQLFTAGQSAFIRGNSSFSEFVMTGMLDSNDLENGDDDSNKLKLAYDNLPKDGMERLIALLDKLNQSEEEAEDEIIEEEPEEEEEEEEEEIEEPEEEEEEETTLNVPLADTKTLFEQMAEEAIVGTDGETGYLILSDGILFDPEYYAAHNPDVVEQFGSKTEELLAHYLIFGKNEKRAPSAKAAKEQEERFKAFAKMIDEDAARMKAEGERSTAQPEEPEDDSNKAASGGTVINPVVFIGNTTNQFNSTNQYIGSNGGTRSDGTISDNNGNQASVTLTNFQQAGRMTVNTPAVINLPMTFTDNNTDPLTSLGNTTVNTVKNINWDETAVGTTVRSGMNEVTKTSTYGYTITSNGNTTTYSDYNSFYNDLNALP